MEAKVTLSHPAIKIRSRVGLLKKRLGFAYMVGGVQPNVFFYNNSLSVVLRALTERLYYVKSKDGFVPCPRPTVSFDTLQKFLRGVRRQLPALPPVWSVERFVQSYTGRKKKRYESAAVSLARRGLRRSDGYLKTFIKAELYNGSNKHNPCPRLIQPRTPEYNIELGRYLRPAEKLIYKAIDRVFDHHVVLKCDNMFTRASTIVKYWREFKKPCFVGLDASRFDQHIGKQALEYEHSLYLSIFGWCPYLKWLLDMQIQQRGFANMCDGTVEYEVEGCRASGDMNTALGNVFLMCAVTHNFLKDLPCRWRFINDGDDCGIFIEAEDVALLDALPAHHLQYGFEMEVEKPVYIIEKVEFCQCRPVQLNTTEWMMVRNIHKAMANDWSCITSRDWCTANDVLVATSRCGLALYAGVPVLDAMYRAMSRLPSTEKKVERLCSEGFTGSWRSLATCHRLLPVEENIARVSIYNAFDILPDYQTQLEDQYRALDVARITLPKYQVEHSPSANIQYFTDI